MPPKKAAPTPTAPVLKNKATIGSNDRFTIGTKLGSGACATVYSITDSKTKHYSCADFPICVKVGPRISSTPGKTNAGKKRKLTDDERLSATINYENTLYNNTLNCLRGVIVPDVMLGGVGYGFSEGADSFGQQWLIMEQMSGMVTDGLINNELSLGETAERLVQCMNALHTECKMVLVDVKSDCFMTTKTKTKTKSKEAGEMAKKYPTGSVRLLDFGLSEKVSSCYCLAAVLLLSCCCLAAVLLLSCCCLAAVLLLLHN